MSLDKIIQPIKPNIEEFNEYLKNTIKSDVFLVDKVTGYILKTKGKQIRPILVFLSSGIISNNINDTSYRIAGLIELLHSATLVHDDVVDDAYMRRGSFSINALWKNKIAVLIGDYLLAKGMMIGLDNKDYEFMSMVSNCVSQMSEGEILQIQKARRLNTNEDIYFEIIKKKTAVLFATCCAGGALSVTQDKKKITDFYNIGLNIGIIFQIKDDLLDFYASDTGKAKGVDLKEHKLTLPIIHLLKNINLKERYLIKRDIKINGSKNIKDIIKLMEDKGSIQYSYNKINEYKQEVQKILDKYPASPFKQSMNELLEYTIKR